MGPWATMSGANSTLQGSCLLLLVMGWDVPAEKALESRSWFSPSPAGQAFGQKKLFK